MCILREIQAHIVGGVLQKDSFKMVYVAPMKALAQEVQATFQKRLGPLGILVKELTGDMQLTKKELAETQLIVTTPEKWDVVTRKNADGGNGGSGLSGLVRLLILDELHLLNEDRGPVLEILVARTLRLVESSQQMCRIVGLSATLPNYNDVAVFVRAQPGTGLFFFDSSYRPVPLSQTFIGVTEPNQMRRLQSMNDVAYKKCLEAVKAGHQVMIFVHSRRDTVKTAKHVIDAARKDENAAFFDTSAEPEYAAFERKIMRSRNSDLTEMFPSGFGCHHAGMIRPDRSLVEAAFSAGIIKVRRRHTRAQARNADEPDSLPIAHTFHFCVPCRSPGAGLHSDACMGSVYRGEETADGEERAAEQDNRGATFAPVSDHR